MGNGHRFRRTATGLATGLAVIASLLVAGGGTANAAPAVVLDGSTAALAAPSCWSIKQNVPAAADGTYWLQTSRLVLAEQFYCDMTTDGGGWVLVGRGRDGWNWSGKGQGSSSAVRTNPTGPNAFAVATLPSATVDGLLGGQPVSALADGVRLRRATNTAGTTWSEVRLNQSTTTNWNWTYGGGIQVANVRVDGTLYSGGNTQNWGADQNYKRINTTRAVAHNYRMGFGFGSSIKATNDPNSYIWSYTTEGNALPFTQVWIRPKLTDGGFTPIPDAGLAGSTVRPLMKDTTETSTTWGVTGIVGGYQSELTLQVEAFAFIGNVTYVGGWFSTVQKGANPGPGESIAQPYLAAFNSTTGEWISSFRPVLDGAVWDLQVTPDNKLIAAGQFTNANGAANTLGLAKLDPTTGATDPTWRANVQYVQTTTPTSPAQVKAVDLQGNWLYLGGRFNRVQGGTSGLITVGRAARVNINTGQPDGAWKPNFDGTIIELDASDQGDRVYFSGYFNNVNATASPMVATVSTASGAALVSGLGAWVPSIGSAVGKTYQQTIKEFGSQVWVGGSQHILTNYNRGDFARMRSSITKAGGDFQAMAIANGVVYASCHCDLYEYSDTYNYTDPISTGSRTNAIKYVGAWDAVTGDFIDAFYPGALDATNGNGVWALEVDPQGCLWFGGDIKQGSWTGTEFQWLGGFGKFCPRDTTAPTTPTNLQAVRSAGNLKLTWGASSDAGTFTYQILRDDRVIGTVPSSATAFNTPDVTYAAKYFVRAVDATGNYSATTPALLLGGGDTVLPSAPGTPSLVSATATSVSLTWAAATDDVGIGGYRVLRNGVQVSGNITAGTSYTDNGLAPSTAYSYTVVAYDTSGNVGPASGAASLSTTADTSAPTAPGGLGVSAVTQTSLHLAWNASTDNVGVVGYRVKRGGTDISGLITATSFDDSGLTANTSYSYTVTAYDAAGNSTASAALPVTTAGGGTITPWYTDTFTGANGSPWNAAWTTTNASGSATIQGNAGSLAYTDVASAYSRALLTGVPAAADADVTFSYAWNSNAAKSYVDIGLRGSGGWQNSYRQKNGYYVEISSSSSTVTVAKNVNGVVTTITTVAGANVLTTGQQKLRLQVFGTTFRFKIWSASVAEPASWSWSGTDADIAAAGQFWISEVRASTNVGDKAIAIDDFSISPTA